MDKWLENIADIEALEDITLDSKLVDALYQQHDSQRKYNNDRPIHFYLPSFRTHQTSELNACHANRWPAVSITGARCRLNCDHCRAEILKPMIAAETPEALWRLTNDLVSNGSRGMLLTGGSNIRNEVEYDTYYSIIRRIKDEFPFFKLALHTGLVNEDMATSMAQAGVDVAMMDIIGSQETITHVYHLKRSVDDFEFSLQSLVGSGMRVVPHIVIGLHYGKLLGEWYALEMLQRHLPDAAVFVVVMPQYANPKKKFETPDPSEVGRFFLDARKAVDELPLLLGCARPSGEVKTQIDAYATMAGFEGIAHPADGMVELAMRLDRKVKVSSSCCSIGLGDGEFLFDETRELLNDSVPSRLNSKLGNIKIAAL